MSKSSEHTKKILESLRKQADSCDSNTAPLIIGNVLSLLGLMNERIEELEREVLPGDSFIEDDDIPGRVR